MCAETNSLSPPSPYRHVSVRSLSLSLSLSLCLFSEVAASHRAPLESCPGHSKSGLHSRLLVTVAASSNNPRVSGL